MLMHEDNLRVKIAESGKAISAILLILVSIAVGR